MTELILFAYSCSFTLHTTFKSVMIGQVGEGCQNAKKKQQQQFGTMLYRQVVGIPMGTNCAPLVADLFLFCYERDFMMCLSDDKQVDVIDAFYTTSRYLDDILNINKVNFDNMVSQIYPSELQLNKVNTSDTKAAFLEMHLSISNDIFLPKFMINVTILILKLSISHFRWLCSSLYILWSLYLSTHSFC